MNSKIFDEVSFYSTFFEYCNEKWKRWSLYTFDNILLSDFLLVKWKRGNNVLGQSFYVIKYL